MTNLTDEGLREMAVMALSDLFIKKPTQNKHWSEIGWDDVNSMTSEDMLKAIVALLQQVRDAARKEEREACAVTAENISAITDYPHYKHTADAIATAIRQME